MELSDDELQEIKDACAYWANNCGGCETCSQIFGNRQLTFDAETVYTLVTMIENLRKQLDADD